MSGKFLKCTVCGSGKITQGRKYNNQHWPDISEFNNLGMMVCESCGFGFIDKELSPEFLEHFYSTIYRAPGSPYYINFNTQEIPLTRDYRAYSQLALALKFTQFKKGDYFVDIGPGEGNSFREITIEYPGVQKVAIELTEGADVVFKRLYDASTYASITEFINTGKRARVALLSHCLEHFNPSHLKAALNEFKGLLCDDGVLIVEVPHVDFRTSEKHRFQDSPHCVFFSLESLKQLFSSGAWEVLFIDTVGLTYKEYFKHINEYESRFQKPSLLKRILNRIFKINLQKKYNGSVYQQKADDSNFSYGGNRIGIRMIARPRKQ